MRSWLYSLGQGISCEEFKNFLILQAFWVPGIYESALLNVGIVLKYNKMWWCPWCLYVLRETAVIWSLFGCVISERRVQCKWICHWLFRGFCDSFKGDKILQNRFYQAEKEERYKHMKEYLIQRHQEAFMWRVLFRGNLHLKTIKYTFFIK